MVAVVIVIDVEPAPTAAATGATAPPAAAPAAPSNVWQGGTKKNYDWSTYLGTLDYQKSQFGSEDICSWKERKRVKEKYAQKEKNILIQLSPHKQANKAQ